MIHLPNFFFFFLIFPLVKSFKPISRLRQRLSGKHLNDCEGNVVWCSYFKKMKWLYSPQIHSNYRTYSSKGNSSQQYKTMTTYVATYFTLNLGHAGLSWAPKFFICISEFWISAFSFFMFRTGISYIYAAKKRPTSVESLFQLFYQN